MIALKILIGLDIVLAVLILVGFLGVPSRNRAPSNRIIIYFTAFLLYHLTYVLISKVYFPAGGWVENSAPFGLAYGPMAYFMTRSFTQMKGIYKRDYWHFVPYLVFWFVHIAILVIGVDYRSSFAEVYMRVLYSLIGMYFLVYGVWSWKLLKNNGIQRKVSYYLIVITAISCVLFFGVAFLHSQISKDGPMSEAQKDAGGVMIYSFTLILELMVLLHVNTLRRSGSSEVHLSAPQSRITTPDGSSTDKIPITSQRYEKSGVSDQDLDRYESKLDEYMEDIKPWMRTDLKLNTLAKELNIPAHHLTQVLNTRKGVSFSHYLNARRIEYACQLLQASPDDVSVEDIGYRSGFNSKTTYYRWFKKIKNMTPLEYLEAHR